MDDTPYTPLNVELQEIRVLEIAPGNYDDDLVITLRIKRLKKKRPKFNALSYVWGKEKCPRRVMLNGRSVIVGLNLDGALRQLRASMSGRLLWIDALCINQENVAERSQQVHLMGDIFSSSERVIVWLGKERSHDQYLVDSIKQWRIPESVEEAVHCSRVLRRVCRRSWFYRVWVVQEFALAKRIPLLQLGPRSISWDNFINFLKLVVDKTLEGDAVKIWPDRSAFEVRDAFYDVSNFEHIRDRSSASLTWQLWMAENLRATDPRDHVYGLLGLCAIRSSLMVPDYSKTVRQVFLDASSCMLQEGKLPYLYIPLYPPVNATTKPTTPPIHLPSWVFDLRIRSRLPISRGGGNDPLSSLPEGLVLFDLERSIYHLPQHSFISSNLERLHTFGVHIGTISADSKDAFFPRANRRLPPHSIYDTYHGILKPRQLSPSHLEAAISFRNRSIDTEAFNLFLAERFTVEQFLAYNDSASDRLSSDKAEEVLSNLFTSGDRIVFITEEGHVGSLYHPEPQFGVRPGDVLVGLFGLNIPFVLRPVKKGTDREQTYTMVNIAHVVEHQYGHDFVKCSEPGAKWEDFEKFGLHEYIIV